MRFNNFPNIVTYEDLRSFFKENRKVLDYLEEYEGLDNLLGSGFGGKVWKIKGKELTLKVTNDEDEIKIAKKLVGKDLKAFLKIYSSIQINGKLQVRIQEMCYPIKYNQVTGLIPRIHTYMPDSKSKNAKEFMDELGRIRSISKTQYPIFEKYIKFLFDVLDDCKKLGISKDNFYELDIYEDNIMQTKDGRLRLVDF